MGLGSTNPQIPSFDGCCKINLADFGKEKSLTARTLVEYLLHKRFGKTFWQGLLPKRFGNHQKPWPYRPLFEMEFKCLNINLEH